MTLFMIFYQPIEQGAALEKERLGMKRRGHNSIGIKSELLRHLLLLNDRVLIKHLVGSSKAFTPL